MLGDSASFTFRHIGFANGIEQRGLSVVDMTQNTYHRRPEHQILGVVFYHQLLFLLLFLFLSQRDRVAAVFYLEQKTVFLGELRRDGLVQRLGNRRKNPHLHQLGDQLKWPHPKSRRKIAHNDRRLHTDQLNITHLSDGHR